MRITSILSALLLILTCSAFSATPEELQAIIDQAGANWRAGINPVSQLSDEEKANLCGTLPGSAYPEEVQAVPPFPNPQAPATYDWRNVGGVNWMTSVKDQLNCGSCWAFGSVGGMEVVKRLACNNPTFAINLSEQHFVSCSDGSCSGWYLDAAMNYLKNQGLPDEACFPYQGLDLPCSQTCSNWQDRIEKINSWNWVTTSSANTTNLKNAILERPIPCYMLVYDDFFDYTGGVYQHTYGDAAGGHAVVLVGWQDSNQCWIVKNSWGAGWGENGYFRIKWGDSQIGTWAGAMYDTCEEVCLEFQDIYTSLRKNCPVNEQTTFNLGDQIQFTIDYRTYCNGDILFEWALFEGSQMVLYTTQNSYIPNGDWCAYFRPYLPYDPNLVGTYAFAARVTMGGEQGIIGYPILNHTFTIQAP